MSFRDARAMLDRTELRAFATARRSGFEELLGELVRVPTVSAAGYPSEAMSRGVELAVAILESFGADVTILAARSGHPVVQGDFHHGAGLPTVAVYNHLDVRPASEPGWRTDPFVLTKWGDTYFGRGTSDNKGPALTALFGIVAARERDVPVNARVLWDFEEEIGSPHLEQSLAAGGSSLAVDRLLVADTEWLPGRVPNCATELRGFVDVVLSLEAVGRDGAAPSGPARELDAVLSLLVDPLTACVRVPGFYEDVSLPPAVSHAPELVLHRLDEAPAGSPGHGAGRAEAEATFWLVPHQRPEKAFRQIRAFVSSQNPAIDIRAGRSSPPVAAHLSWRDVEDVRDAVLFGFGKNPVFLPDGGSISAVAALKKCLKCPLVFLGVSLPEHGSHGPNEYFEWRQARDGVAAFARYLDNVARRRHPAAPGTLTRT